MTVNKEHMEQWIAALEAYDREPAKGMLRDHEGRMCAMGIGIETMRPGMLTSIARVNAVVDFYYWLGVRNGGYVTLKPDGSSFDCIPAANDYGDQSPWTIAQRLRETYLKDES